MKIGVICSSYADLELFKLLQDYSHEYVVFLDNRFGPYGQMSWEDSVERLNNCLNDDTIKGCDRLILSPVYELYGLYSGTLAKDNIIPLRTHYITTQVLPYSIVGKIGCIGHKDHLDIIGTYWNSLTQYHEFRINQTKNKHFQKQFPLYKLNTDHRNVLYDLPRSWFVNKLIKIDLKKMKDYAIDSLIPLEYGYFKYQKTILGAFHKKVRFHTLEKLGATLDGVIKNNQSEYDICIIHTGDIERLQSNKKLMWLLGRGRKTDIEFQKIVH